MKFNQIVPYAFIAAAAVVNTGCEQNYNLDTNPIGMVQSERPAAAPDTNSGSQIVAQEPAPDYNGEPPPVASNPSPSDPGVPSTPMAGDPTPAPSVPSAPSAPGATTPTACNSPSSTPATSNPSGEIPQSAKCGNNLEKIFICHLPQGNPGNAHTLCVSINGAINGHQVPMDGSVGPSGDFLGPCVKAQ